jgi:hypothetical protein
MSLLNCDEGQGKLTITFWYMVDGAEIPKNILKIHIKPG